MPEDNQTPSATVRNTEDFDREVFSFPWYLPLYFNLLLSHMYLNEIMRIERENREALAFIFPQNTGIRAGERGSES